MYNLHEFEVKHKKFRQVLQNIKEVDKKRKSLRDLLNNTTYTIQQSIGAAFDALPAGKSNTARKLNGDLFENFIKLILHEMGIDNTSGVIHIPVKVKNEKLFKMSYQHDLIIKKDEEIKVIGSIKTSSKDRIDKIFIDKFLYSKLSETQTPHIAIFLNDVQRKKTAKENEFGINSTFLTNHFKGYSIKLNPLDGVYYCDIRPNMKTDHFLKNHIKTFDRLLISDIWKLIK
jgi:hypothetical protein